MKCKVTKEIIVYLSINSN